MSAGTASSAERRCVESRDSAQAGRESPPNELLDRCRLYLLAIAEEELSGELRRKVGASDLVQDTLARGLEQFADFRGHTPEELAGWLRRILLNHLSNVRKAFGTEKRSLLREHPMQVSLADPHCVSPSQHLQVQEEAARVASALNTLPDDQRRAIELRHKNNYSFAEIGLALGCSENTACKLWGRAVKRLQSLLQRNACGSSGA